MPARRLPGTNTTEYTRRKSSVLHKRCYCTSSSQLCRSNRLFAGGQTRDRKTLCWRAVNSLWKDRKKKEIENYHFRWCKFFVCLVAVKFLVSSMAAWTPWLTSFKGPISKWLWLFFRLRFVIGSKVSRHFLNQSEAKLEPFMTYTPECVCFEMWLVLVIMSSRCDRPELLL